MKCTQHFKPKMEFSNTDFNAYKAKIYGSVRRSLSGTYKDEPQFFGPSAIINNLFRWGIAKAEIIPREFQICRTEIKSNREIRQKLAWDLEHGSHYWKQASKSMSGWKTPHKVNFFNSFNLVEKFSYGWKPPYNQSQIYFFIIKEQNLHCKLCTFARNSVVLSLL